MRSERWTSIAEAAWPRWPILSLRDPKAPAFELLAVELLDGVADCRLFGELHEGEAARATGVAICGQKHLHHLADFRKQRLELALGRFVAQVSDKYA